MKVLFLSVFALLVSAMAFSQGKAIEVIYTKAYKNFRDTSHSAPRPLKNLEYSLSCSPVASRFERIASLRVSDQQFIRLGGGQGIYYKNTKERIKLHQNTFADSTYLIKEDYKLYKWELKEEKKYILGIECYKAVSTYREYIRLLQKYNTITTTVWYAPGIPFAFGPAGYDGLPGLVLESHSGSFYFIATSIRFSDQEKKIPLPDKGKKLSREAYGKKAYQIIMDRKPKQKR